MFEKFKKFAEVFLWSLKGERRIAKNTQLAYKQDLDDFLNFIKSQNNIEQILQKFFEVLNEKQLKPATVQRKMIVINQFLEFCQEEKLIEININDKPKIKIDKNFSPFLETGDIDKIRKRLEQKNTKEEIRLSAIVEVLYSTGLRISELLKIKYKDYKEIVETKSLIIQGKGQRERIVFFNKRALEGLEIYVKIREEFGKSEFLWASRNKHLTRQRVFQLLKNLAQECAIDEKKMFPHSFRHRLLTDLVKGGADLISVQAIAGHKQINTTERYTHIEDYLYADLQKFHPLSKTNKK